MEKTHRLYSVYYRSPDGAWHLNTQWKHRTAAMIRVQKAIDCGYVVRLVEFVETLFDETP